MSIMYVSKNAKIQDFIMKFDSLITNVGGDTAESGPSSLGYITALPPLGQINGYVCPAVASVQNTVQYKRTQLPGSPDSVSLPSRQAHAAIAAAATRAVRSCHSMLLKDATSPSK